MDALYRQKIEALLFPANYPISLEASNECTRMRVSGSRKQAEYYSVLEPSTIQTEYCSKPGTWRRQHTWTVKTTNSGPNSQ